MKTLITAALAAGLLATPALAQTRAQKPLPTGRAESLHVVSINLDDETGTTIVLRDAKGVRLEPVMIPLSICRKDRLGRLLPGLDVDVVTETKRTDGGKAVRYVRPERFRPWCN